MASKFYALILILFLSLSARADVVSPGDIKLQFTFTNLDKFPGFTFYYLHHGYHYNMGWHPDTADTSLVENNKNYTVSERGNTKSFLMALPMMNSYNKYSISDAEIGGGITVDPAIKSIIEVYTITGMENGIIKIKKVKDILQYEDGRKEDRKAGSGWIGISHQDNFTRGLTLVSAGALLVMLCLFLFRARKPRYIQMAT